MAEFIPAILEPDREGVFRLLSAFEGVTPRAHIDFTDNSLVASMTALPAELDGLQTSCKLDAHLMVDRPTQYLVDLARLGFERVILHVESYDPINESIEQAGSLGLLPILTLNLESSIEMLRDYASDVDIIQIMAVDPGFTGQPFVDEAYDRIREVKRLYPHVAVFVDGGVRTNNAPHLMRAGAEALIASRRGFEQNGDLRAGIKAWQDLIATL